MSEYATVESLIGGITASFDMHLIDPDVVVKIRPLSAIEYHQVKARKLRGVKVQANEAHNPTLDMEKNENNDFSGNCLAISLAVVTPTMTEEQAGKLPQKTFFQLIKEIDRRSGVGTEARTEIDSFRAE